MRTAIRIYSLIGVCVSNDTGLPLQIIFIYGVFTSCSVLDLFESFGGRYTLSESFRGPIHSEDGGSMFLISQVH